MPRDAPGERITDRRKYYDTPMRLSGVGVGRKRVADGWIAASEREWRSGGRSNHISAKMKKQLF